MLDLGLFRKPAFAGASIAAFALSASMFAMFLYLTLYIQDVLGYSPLAGRAALPAAHAAVVLRRADRGAARRAGAGAHAARRRADARRRRPAADGRPEPAPAGPRCCPASCSPAPGSAWSTRRSPRPRSASCRPRAAAWPRASTTPSARSASPPASPALGAIFQHQVQTKFDGRWQGTPRPVRAIRSAHAVRPARRRQAIDAAPPASRGVIAARGGRAFIGGRRHLRGRGRRRVRLAVCSRRYSCASGTSSRTLRPRRRRPEDDSRFELREVELHGHRVAYRSRGQRPGDRARARHHLDLRDLGAGDALRSPSASR